MYDQCDAIEQSNHYQTCLEFEIDESFLLAGYEFYCDKARHFKEFYCQKIEDLMTMYGIEDETNVLLANVSQLKERQGFHKQDRHEIAQLVRIQMNAIKKKVKAMFYKEFRDDVENNEDVLKKVSALYYVSYAKSSTEDGSIPVQTRSLP